MCVLLLQSLPCDREIVRQRLRGNQLVQVIGLQFIMRRSFVAGRCRRLHVSTRSLPPALASCVLTVFPELGPCSCTQRLLLHSLHVWALQAAEGQSYQ